MLFRNRTIDPIAYASLLAEGAPSVLAKAWAGRNIHSQSEVAGSSFADLIPYSKLTGAVKMAEILADGIRDKKRFLIVADYDADGATACSVGMLGLSSFGADIHYIVPDRQVHGYGLSPSIVDLALEFNPDYIITVDNGIAAHAGIDYANSKGIEVLVTDHHLPTEIHPNAKVIVNPSQHGCSFESKALAGVGVIWYVLWALQNILFERDMLPDSDFSVDKLLPIVAVGTVADLVTLDFNNRTLVKMGMDMLKRGEVPPGIDALSRIAKRSPAALSTADIGFGIAPRINAAGRLDSMTTGINCLISTDMANAMVLAASLDETNKDRKERESVMADEAINQLVRDIKEDRKSIALFSENWHIGIIGIVAGRIKEKCWRPTFVMAKAEGHDDEIKGSGRSIPGFHLRDAMALIDSRYPDIFLKFGGHAMAAGMTIRASKLKAFQDAFEEVCNELLTDDMLQQVILTDGSLTEAEMCIDTVRLVREQVWGQNFAEPLFRDEFEIINARIIGKTGNTLKLALRKRGGSEIFEAIRFKHTSGLPFGMIDAVYRLDVNDYNGVRSLQLQIDQYELLGSK